MTLKKKHKLLKKTYNLISGPFLSKVHLEKIAPFRCGPERFPISIPQDWKNPWEVRPGHGCFDGGLLVSFTLVDLLSL